jgi:hypothetical protein
MIKRLLSTLFLIFISCKSAISISQDLKKCSIIEESFERSSMRKFLITNEDRRDILDKFNEDNSKYAFLSITNGDFVYATLKDNYWEVINNEKQYKIYNDNLISQIESYSKKNTVYKYKCPEDFVVFDGNHEFKAIWIKENGIIRFLYYTTSYDITYLNDNDKSKIASLIEIDDLLKKSR